MGKRCKLNEIQSQKRILKRCITFVFEWCAFSRAFRPWRLWGSGGARCQQQATGASRGVDHNTTRAELRVMDHTSNHQSNFVILEISAPSQQGARSGFPTLSVGSIVPVGAQVCPYESNEPSSTLLRVIQPAQSRNSEIRPSSKRPKVRPQLCFRAHRMQIACEKWPCYYINRAQWFHPAQLPP